MSDSGCAVIGKQSRDGVISYKHSIWQQLQILLFIVWHKSFSNQSKKKEKTFKEIFVKNCLKISALI